MTPRAQRKPPGPVVTFEDLQARKKPVTKTVAVVLDDDDESDDESAVAWFTFRAVGCQAYRELIEAHPPTLEQRTKAKADGVGDIAWDYDTFPAALVAASLADPVLSVDQVLVLWADPNWNQAELGLLVNTALEVNSTRGVVPRLGVAGR